jgi:solute carrier family 35, member F1/2
MSANKDFETMAVRASSIDYGSSGPSAASPSAEHQQHGAPELVDDEPNAPKKPKTMRERFAYFTTKEFWFILFLGQFLAVCITGTNTMSGLLADAGTNIPAFQSFFNYVLLNLVYTGYTFYKYGFAKWGKMVWKDGWKYIILGFFDVQGNYFTVLAYNYTTIMSAQLINFWAIVVVVFISFVFLKVRYHWAQVIGIIICIGGVGVLIGSDHVQGATIGGIPVGNQVKGDLFALLGASCYGLTNVYEEWFVSGRPLYEVIGQLGFWGMIISGVQCAIFDRDSFERATWNGEVAGYLVGFTLILFIFYTLVPVLYRFASAAFMNISLLTGNFWGAIIGIKVFGLSVHWMYPIAFVLIIVGQFVYYVGKGILGEAKKAWLGEDQARGIDGFGSAKRKMRKMGMAGVQRGDEGVQGAGVV